MIGLWNAHAQAYLLVLMAITTITFALPLFILPLAWARLFRWKMPSETDLALYFGRCLGAFVLVVEALMLRAGMTGEGLIYTFQVLLAVAALMVIVHVSGAVQRVQPITETLEIGMYAGMFILTVLFYPTL
jgi:hypothetical protein